MTHIVGLDVLVRVFHPIIDHHHCDSSASDVALPHPCYVDVHTLIDVIVLQQQEEKIKDKLCKGEEKNMYRIKKAKSRK